MHTGSSAAHVLGSVLRIFSFHLFFLLNQNLEAIFLAFHVSSLRNEKCRFRVCLCVCPWHLLGINIEQRCLETRAATPVCARSRQKCTGDKSFPPLVEGKAQGLFGLFFLFLSLSFGSLYVCPLAANAHTAGGCICFCQIGCARALERLNVALPEYLTGLLCG